MEENHGLVIYNKMLKSYFSHDGNFVGRIASAKTYYDRGICQWELNKIANTYKEVESYNADNLEIKKVSVQLID